MSDKILDKELSLAEKQILYDKVKTTIYKDKLISEFKNGLGKEMLKNPKTILKPKPFYYKFFNFLKKVFKTI